MNWLRKLFASTPPPVAPQGMYRVKKASIPVNAIPSPLNPVVSECAAIETPSVPHPYGLRRNEYGELNPTPLMRGATGQQNMPSAYAMVTGTNEVTVSFATGQHPTGDYPVAVSGSPPYMTGTRLITVVSGYMTNVVYQAAAMSGSIGRHIFRR